MERVESVEKVLEKLSKLVVERFPVFGAIIENEVWFVIWSEMLDAPCRVFFLTFLSDLGLPLLVYAVKGKQPYLLFQTFIE